jgi:hypothetical protein
MSGRPVEIKARQTIRTKITIASCDRRALERQLLRGATLSRFGGSLRSVYDRYRFFRQMDGVWTSGSDMNRRKQFHGGAVDPYGVCALSALLLSAPTDNATAQQIHTAPNTATSLLSSTSSSFVSGSQVFGQQSNGSRMRASRIATS